MSSTTKPPSLEVRVWGPAPERCNLSAKEWNRTHSVGCAVRFWPTDGSPIAYETVTRSGARRIGELLDVVSLVGFPGGVPIRRLQVIGPTAHVLKEPDVSPDAAPAQAALAALTAVAALTDEQRLEVFSVFCVHCGSDDPRCQCWNDE